MPTYTLKPKSEFLKKVNDLGESFDMLLEGQTVVGIIIDKYRFPDARKSLQNYTINISEKYLKIELGVRIDEKIHDFLENYWEIKED